MTQIALPLAEARLGEPSRIIVGAANAAVIEALGHTAAWPFGTAILTGPPRSGKSLLARWFASQNHGEAIDDADLLDETALFHRWNRAQESGAALLWVVSSARAATGWQAKLPDLASRLGAALPLAIGAPDDAMLRELIALHAELRGLVLGDEALAYLAARAERSHLGAETLVATIDRLSLERKAPPTMAIWRDALEAVLGPREPRLL